MSITLGCSTHNYNIKAQCYVTGDRILCPTSFKSQSEMLAVTFLLMYLATHF